MEMQVVGRLLMHEDNPLSQDYCIMVVLVLYIGIIDRPYEVNPRISG